MADKELFGISEQLDCSDCVNHGGDWDCDHVQCRKGTDTISRQEALDALEKEKPTPFVNKDGSVDPFGAGRQNQWYRDGIAIMNLPSVDAVPVAHGYWKAVTDDGIDYKRICSCCGEDAPFDESEDAYLLYPHCPWCGASLDIKGGNGNG